MSFGSVMAINMTECFRHSNSAANTGIKFHKGFFLVAFILLFKYIQTPML